MNPTNKPKPKLTPRQIKELKQRLHALFGKYKGMGLMKAFLAEKEREKNC